ncbi:hypothetical protein OCGS_0296 [Oceaniovalibus guishaninsula JLT2003]|uniref:Uncharacterized protein n=1 Tax=Oceaniovalibus guishaninsula JLT2003 TaxID=1231392 RepID=K2HST3_9RHOB|nr:hypothetical protein [Oceaniovalibus guishaninsula]EKE45679.1 hypothetical protein OCGS_0296 [Oceaniovalibus guishaninsula JLT2003]
MTPYAFATPALPFRMALVFANRFAQVFPDALRDGAAILDRLTDTAGRTGDRPAALPAAQPEIRRIGHVEPFEDIAHPGAEAADIVLAKAHSE